jgi:hypothetical protein
MINIKLAIIIFLTLDFLAAVFSSSMGFDWFVNMQVGFISSFIVIILSLFGYKKMVENKIALTDENLIERDVIDKIEDPYDLYDDYDDEKLCQKTSKLKENIKHVKTSARGYFSIYRIGGYTLFFISFLMLIKSGYFLFLPFIIGISIMPLGTLIYGIFSYSIKKFAKSFEFLKKYN